MTKPADTQEELNRELINGVIMGDIKLCERCLFLGADVHAENEYPLERAAEFGRTDIVTLFLECGADVNSKNNHALDYAAARGHVRVVELILKAGSKIQNHDLAMQFAAERLHVDVMERLIAAGADITLLFQATPPPTLLREFHFIKVDLVQRFAPTACRGYEAAMLLEESDRVNVLGMLHPEMNTRQILDQLAMMETLGLNAEKSGALWKEMHGAATQEQQELKASL